MRHHNLDVPSATKTAKSLRPIIDPIGMCVAARDVPRKRVMAPVCARG